jgi:hypothetical protein
MNLTVARLTARSLLGRRRTLPLLALPALLLLLSVAIRWTSHRRRPDRTPGRVRPRHDRPAARPDRRTGAIGLKSTMARSCTAG